MKLYVMRHGFAGEQDPDPKRERERPLTLEGRATVTAIAQAMDQLGEVPNSIFSSPFTRSQQTADIVGKLLGVEVNPIGDLAPQRPLDNAILDLICVRRMRRVMIVGHVDNTSPAFKDYKSDTKWEDLVMGEIRRLEIDRDDGSWKLKWRLRPSELGRKDHK